VSAALGWRWTFWIGLIMAGVCWVPIVFFPETYGPVLLSRRAQKLRNSGANTNIYAQIELEKKGFKQMATVTLTRPIRMLVFEPIVAASCAYLALAYGIFYLFFEAYPIIFGGIYGMSSGVSGLMFLPIGIGMFIGVGLFLPYDGKILAPARAKGKSWSLTEEARRLPLAFVGGPLYVVSLFWMGWTAKESIHWIVPALAGLPFGIGFIFIFIALLNYLTDAYDVFAASAMAAAGCTRSIAGVLCQFSLNDQSLLC
jgi:MFS family permease